MKQRYNTEHDVAVLEAAAEDAGNPKFIFDRVKISIENKVIIDNHLLDGSLLSSVNYLQVSGLEVHFLNTTLQEPGLYITKELYCHNISKSLASLTLYLDLASQLLCFWNDCVSELTEKGTWNSPRSNKSRIPPPSANLWKPRT
ncbi:hypothetical protein A0J61_00313 [Choanephora cucurbitarum]|uniref:Uncharacterized protein n=1 Tax=Choanephora cucurbitarum TaxID=101091 RepID=A0A1C7NRB7_9FUNG|nr:hypothetical protein A0J61_00313 [Choanephora cucurbitarum]